MFFRSELRIQKCLFLQEEGPSEEDFFRLYEEALTQLLELRQLGYTAAVVTQVTPPPSPMSFTVCLVCTGGSAFLSLSYL